MPDWKHCVKCGGKTYCWDFEKQKVVEVEVVIREVPLTQETEDIFRAIMASAVTQADRAGS